MLKSKKINNNNSFCNVDKNSKSLLLSSGTSRLVTDSSYVALVTCIFVYISYQFISFYFLLKFRKIIRDLKKISYRPG